MDRSMIIGLKHRGYGYLEMLVININYLNIINTRSNIIYILYFCITIILSSMYIFY